MKDNDPLSFLKTVYMDAELPLTTRMRAAMAILPFVHPKLAVIAQVHEDSLAEVLDRRLRKIEEMRNGNGAKLIEPPATLQQIAAPIDIKSPKPHVNDRRFRRF